jgi:hypothetical protein
VAAKWRRCSSAALASETTGGLHEARPAGSLGTLALALEVFILSGCFSSFIAPDSAARPDQDVAIINNRCGCPFCVRWIRRTEDNILVYEARRDGQDVNPLRLMPGRHQISVVWWNLYSRKGVSRLETSST